MRKTTFKKGEWNAICDRCGFEYKSSQMKKEWNNLRVCKDCYEPRHPQDFVRGKKDDQSVSWTRAEGADVETDTSGWVTPTSVPDGTFNNNISALLSYFADDYWAADYWAASYWAWEYE